MLREMVGFVQYYEARSESIRDLVKALPGGGDSVMPTSDSGLYYLPRAGPLAPLAAQAACARLQLAAAGNVISPGLHAVSLAALETRTSPRCWSKH